MTARRGKSTGEYCAEIFIKEGVRTCSNECSRGCSKVFIISIVAHLNDILNSGVRFSSFKEFLMAGIEKYQKDISPKLNVRCLFEPSCSNYAIGVIQKYGVIKGLIKAFARVIKCSPLTKRLPSRQIVDFP